MDNIEQDSSFRSVMECNKEEAVRAKQIAEQKMETKDFLGARKFAVKAQKLYSELENVSQLITVCDVHCSAENKIYGTEMDWYGILKIEPTADDALIKKQFRKLALILHPDKNKFCGSADAFKLIGEAQSVLLDREKRRSHDNKCKFAAAYGAAKEAKEANRPSNVRKSPGPGNRFMNSNTQFHQVPQTSQTGSYGNRPTFWTVCPFCSVRYQYYRDVLNKLLGCQSCGKSFTGSEVTAQRSAPKNNLSQSVLKKGSGNQGPSKVGPQSNVGNTTKVEVEGNGSNGNTRLSEVATGSKPNGKIGDDNRIRKQKRKAEKPQPHQNKNEKKRRQLSESSDSFNSETSIESEEEISFESGGFCSEQLPRRSSRSKRNVSYSENIADDNDTAEPSGGNNCSGTAPPSKEAVENSSLNEASCNTNKSTGLDTDVELNEKVAKWKEPSVHAVTLQTEGKETENEKPTEDAETKPEVFDVPDPDFNNFDKEREENCFAAGQIWAIYDTQDAMPRYYAQIRKVLRPHFKLRITWLELDPVNKDEIKWSEEDLPISCGNFRYGSSENTEDHGMFSHLVSWEKGRGRDTFLIYPRKGETWALFKNWDINWSSYPDNKRNYTYEFVEIVSDYADGIAISVAYLVKVKGFSCLFCRTKGEGDELVEIAPKELLRFSHRIPSFRLTGKEREDVPAGSFELDLACLPTNIEEIDAPASGKTVTENMHSVGSCSKFATVREEQVPIFHVDVSKNQAERESRSDIHVNISREEEDQNLQSHSNFNTVDNLTDDSSATLASPEEAYEIPDPEFYNFDADKSLEKLEIGQIWALYCDEDGLPKYYGIIKKIDLQPELRLHITWLVFNLTPNGMIQWIDKKMPVTCGRFTQRKMKKPMLYTGTSSFSHQVRARVERINKKDEYLIFPRKGEVWALYKSWNAGMKCSELENCEYEMVEVVEENDLGISVLILEPVDGFKSVFKVLPRTIRVPSNELLRFSHQIPAFRLTEERDGSLRGYLELDPAALPFEWFCSR